MQRWLAFTGFLLALESLALLVLIAVSQTGVTEVFFGFATLRVNGQPGEVVVNGLPFSGLAIYLVLAPVALFSAASGLRLAFGGRPEPALVGALGWTAIAAYVFLRTGGIELLVGEGLLALAIALLSADAVSGWRSSRVTRSSSSSAGRRSAGRRR